ncbi:MAG TPA: cytochrome c peroxidase, partial [Bacteroidia bacterium]
RYVQEFINPLYALNAKIILKRGYRSGNMTDYSLNSKALSIFDKQLYTAQNDKGIFGRVTDPATIAEIDQLGKLLFYDPILSGNNQRSCASCHIPTQYYADTVSRTALKFNKMGRLTRNTPSTINAGFNHLIMADGKHLTLQEQAVAVMCNMDEMGSVKGEILEKVMSCKAYSDALTRLAKLTPQSPKPGIDHIVSAITLHYGKFSLYDSPFDRAMNKKEEVNQEVVLGYNLFMSKAQCATCHFVPQFNGVKPPYVGSEFEVLGVPEDTNFIKLSSDSGRYYINPAFETFRAFRTGTIRNASKTAPYMHNGVFRTLTEVVQFYNNGGAQGRGLQLENQTLSGDKLGLTEYEIRCLVLFMESLTENIVFEPAPEQLPKSKKKTLNNRIVGGNY